MGVRFTPEQVSALLRNIHIGFKYCNKKIFCNKCPLFKEKLNLCKDYNFIKESKNRIKELEKKYNNETVFEKKEKLKISIDMIKNDINKIINYEGFISINDL